MLGKTRGGSSFNPRPAHAGPPTTPVFSVLPIPQRTKTDAPA